MKTTILTTLTIIILGSVTTMSVKANTPIEISVKKDKITTTFGVRGNCGICKETIEESALSVAGVSKANWDRKKKQITITYDSSKTNLEKIHQAIANSGYDTELVTAQDLDYNKLPGCCQYDREMSIKQEETGKGKSTKKSKSCH